jgi:translocation and assembly module TamB
MTKRKALRSVVTSVAAVLALVATFVVAAVAGLALHLPLPPSRRLATRAVSGVLGGGIRGSVDIARFEKLSLRGFEARDVVIRDPRGDVVLATPRLSARADVAGILASALLGDGPIDVRFTFVRADQIDVNLIEDEAGDLTLAQTFLAVEKPPPAAPKAPAAPTRPIVFDLPAIEVGSVRMRGRMQAVGLVDADAQGVSGAVHAGPGEVRIDTRPFPVVVPRTLPAVLSMTTDFHFRTPAVFWSSFVASFGDILLSGKARLDGSYVDAELDVPRTTTDPFLPYVPDLKPSEPVEGHFEWHGALPHLATLAKLQVGTATIDTTGWLALKGDGTAFDVSMRHVNLATVRGTLPETDLGLDAHVVVEHGGGKPLRAKVTGEIPATTIEGVALPDTRVDVAWDAEGMRGKAWLQEPGMPVEASVEVTRLGEVQVKAVSRIESLGAVARLSKAVDGRADAVLDAKWAAGKLDATLTADVARLRRGSVSLGLGRVTVHAWGPPEALEMEADVNGSHLAVGGLGWGRASASLRGPVGMPRATIQLRDDKLPSVKADATLVLAGAPGLRGVTVMIDRYGEQVIVRTKAIQPRGSDIELGKLSVEGLGDPFEAEGRIGPRGFKLGVRADRLNLSRLADLFDLPIAQVKGDASLRLDLEADGAEATGCIAVDMRNAQVFAPDVDVSFRAQLAGTHVRSALRASIAGTRHPENAQDDGLCMSVRPVRGAAVADVAASADLGLAGPLLDPASWRQAVGTMRVSNLSVDFNHPLMQSAAKHAIPKMTGLVVASATVERDAQDPLPSVVVEASTKGFSIDLGDDKDPRLVQGADLFASASLTPAGRWTTSACLRNDGGEFGQAPCDPRNEHVLVTLGSVVDLDYAGLLEHGDRWRKLLATAEVDAKLTVLDRTFNALKRPVPGASNLPFDAQRAGGWIRMQGSLVEPRFDYAFQVLDVAPLHPDWRLSTTVCAQGSYAGARAGLYADVLQRVGDGPKDGASLEQLCRDPAWRAQRPDRPPLFRPLGNVTANVDVDWSLALRAPSIDHVPWVADVAASLHDIDLSDVPILADEEVQGRLGISGSVRNLGLDPDFGLQVTVDGLRVGTAARYDRAELRVQTSERGMSGKLQLRERVPRRGLVDRLVAAFDTRQVQWTEGLSPRLSSDESVDAWVEAEGFDVSVLGPLVSPTLSYLEGRLDGSAYGTWSPKPGASELRMVDMTLTDGAFEVPLLGQEFTGATAHIVRTRRDQLSVRRLVARAASGAVAANATIDLTNLVPSHLEVAMASDRKNRIRLTYEGIPLGDFDGEIYAHVSLGSDRNQAVVEIDKGHLELSESGLRDVQQTTLNPDISVVPTVTSRGRILRLSRAGENGKGLSEGPAKASGAVPWYVRFVTPSPLLVTRSDLDVAVSSPNDTSLAPLLIYPDDRGRAVMAGYIEIVDGKLNVVGKKFELERGSGRVVFNGDPASPSVNLSTRWDAPDGTRIMADVTGPLKDPAVRFRSVPSRPASEILSMILTGTTGTETAATSSSTSKGNDTSAAAGVGGGVAAVGVNRLLQDVSPINVSTRVDTSESQNVRPTIAVEVARNVTAETSVNTGALAPGQTQDVYMLTLDWRFLREWSMRTTVGNKGSSVFDVVWRHRY